MAISRINKQPFNIDTMKKQIQILAALGMMSAMTSHASVRGTNDGSFGHGVPDEKPKVIPKGCKEFRFYGFTVIASSEKQAIRKCQKLYNKSTQKL